MNKKEGGKSHQGCRREKIGHRLSPIYYTSIAIFKDFDNDRTQARTVIKGINKKNTIGGGRFCPDLATEGCDDATMANFLDLSITSS